MSFARPRQIEISLRLIVAALLHAAYLYFVYKYEWFVRRQTEPLLLIGAACAVGIAVATPVVWRGDWVERLMAVLLLLSPACWMWHVMNEIHRLWAG